MVKKLMEKVLEALVEEEKSLNPERYKGNDYCYYLIVIEKLNELIEKYDAAYLAFENEIINDVIVDYDFDGFWDFIFKRYSDEVYKLIQSDEDYYIGMNDSDDEEVIDAYNDIYCSSVETIAQEKTGLAIHAFYELDIEEKLFSLLLIDKLEKELSESFSNYIGDEAGFLEENTLNNIISVRTY